MAIMSAGKRMLPTVACMVAVALVLVVDVVASEESSYGQTYQGQEASPVTFPDAEGSGFQGAILNKGDIKREMIRQLLILQEAEETIRNKIRELQAEKRAMSNRKRSHYNSMCMFNVVACYRK
ncbi:unnamed protein product [Candidula unifasciata]|uniref:Uncharacterized protein n=1 Tax=Candidula unifasciata TaxID=100452 RepID=A0A8S3ZIC2_9EUPU|nr:unnamed protein product [Candidula unifasciata]